MSNKIIKLRDFPGEVRGLETAALVCDLFMLAIFLWNQIVYSMDMLVLIVSLTLIGLWLLFFCVFPETYRFTQEELQLTHRFRKTIAVPYAAVFNYDAASRDRFINLLQSNRVKIYFTRENRRQAIVCTPRDVEGFVETLKNNCPEFDLPEKEKSRLDVFFGNTQQIESEKEMQDE